MKNSIFNYINKENLYKNKIKNIKLNFGPQHPAAHGVLRLILQLNNEKIIKNDTHIGLLHRGTEKLIENRIYINSLPYFDRLDYVSMLLQEHAYCLAIEKLYKNDKYISELNYIRIIFDELTRILNHLLAISCHSLDTGCMSTIFWGFEEREKILEFYERISGARMHAALYKPNKCLNYKINKQLLNDILNFCNNFINTLNEINNTLTNNKIFKIRLINVGKYSLDTAKNYSLTGVMSRCVGFKKDLRLDKYTTYSCYKNIKFNSFISSDGDSYSRYLLRMSEMFESCKIINISINKILNIKLYDKNKLNILNNNYEIDLLNKYFTMEATINHFKYWTDNFIIKKNNIYSAVESAKGEFGVILFSNNTNKPFKCKIRSPSYFHLQLLNNLLPGIYLADLVMLIGTIDIVFGEIDK